MGEQLADINNEVRYFFIAAKLIFKFRSVRQLIKFLAHDKSLIVSCGGYIYHQINHSHVVRTKNKPLYHKTKSLLVILTLRRCSCGGNQPHGFEEALQLNAAMHPEHQIFSASSI